MPVIELLSLFMIRLVGYNLKGLVHFSAGLGFVVPKVVNSEKMYLTLSEPGANPGVRYGFLVVTMRLRYEADFVQRHDRR